MNKKARVAVYTENAVSITAKLNDFDGTVSEWKNAVYELFRYDMTWSFAYKIHVRESRSGVFVQMTIKPSYKTYVLEAMQDLGFKNIIATDEAIGTIECTDFPEDMLLDYIEVQY